MYYVIENGVAYTAEKRVTLEKLYNNVQFIECTEKQYQDNEYMIQGSEIVKNPDYKKEQLEKAKVSKLSDINTAKEAAFKQGITFMGAHFDCDDRAQDRTGNRLLLLNAMPV